MTRSVARGTVSLGLLVACTGCAAQPPETPISQQNLFQVGVAYFEATKKNNRPPANVKDLLPYLKGEPDKILRSENDGEEFVILWGIDHRGYVSAGKGIPVTAYEKTGKGDKRLVLRGNVIFHLTDEEFRAAPFPKGQKAP